MSVYLMGIKQYKKLQISGKSNMQIVIICKLRNITCWNYNI